MRIASGLSNLERRSSGRRKPGRSLKHFRRWPRFGQTGSPQAEIPAAWLKRFPSGEEIIRKTVELRSDAALNPDKRLLRRRECEFEIFKSVEEAVELPVIKAGFSSIEEFTTRAQTILQRRKSRYSTLELHARALFVEEGLKEGSQFVHQPPESDPGKRGPDFLFPSSAAYADGAFPANRLRMLAVKTTCKDRWRQILTEADRITTKHLLTLQEGVSEKQFQEMVGEGVQLVVPEPLEFPSVRTGAFADAGEFYCRCTAFREMSTTGCGLRVGRLQGIQMTFPFFSALCARVLTSLRKGFRPAVKA